MLDDGRQGTFPVPIASRRAANWLLAAVLSVLARSMGAHVLFLLCLLVDLPLFGDSGGLPRGAGCTF